MPALWQDRYDIVKIAQPVQLHVEHVHLGPQTRGDFGSRAADHAHTDHQHRARIDTWHPANQNAVAMLGHLQVLAPSWMAMAPATWLMGLSNGREPSAVWMVS